MDGLQPAVLSKEEGPVGIVESLSGLASVSFGIHGRVEMVYVPIPDVTCGGTGVVLPE